MKINYGDYEAHHAFASVKGRYEADLPIDEVSANLDERVFSLMAPQLAAAKDFAIAESFVLRIPTD